jgi:hypothetical protein
MSGCAVVSEMDPLRAAGPIPQGFVAPQSKVSTFSFVAPRFVEEFLAALPARVFQQALSQLPGILTKTRTSPCGTVSAMGQPS